MQATEPTNGTRGEIRFRFRGREVALSGFSPRLTLLDWLRTEAGATGTKEGCNEGDCGACTVVLARRSGEATSFVPVNACILLLGQIDGAELITIEDLAQGETLHPVQEALVVHNGSQCGFCTPGIVMSLFAQHESGPATNDAAVIEDQLAGNLCRCTGYRPIIDAALAAHESAPLGLWQGRVDDGDDVFIGDAARFFAAPASFDTLAALYEAHPDATLVSGATDVGLWITKGLQDIQKVIWLGRVAEFDLIEDLGDGWGLGAGATHAALLPVLAAIHPDLGEVMRRFGSVQVRASGTLGGNIANGSPIGDLAPCLIALGATLVLQKGKTTRKMPLEDFFIAYRKQDRLPGEFVRALIVPKLTGGQSFRAYKISKRLDEDISSVLAAFRFDIAQGRIGAARMAYGGMAGTPARARNAEGFIIGARLEDEATWAGALTALRLDFQPLTDQRASAQYRSLVARNLLRKALLELRGADLSTTRVAPPRESAHV
jgi:xanthine dehydrogenase small subunit